jgi:hypothetical protein
MKHDPVIARIRAARHDISARFDHDPHKLVEHYLRTQKRHAGRLLEVAPDASRDLAVSEKHGAYGSMEERRK